MKRGRALVPLVVAAWFLAGCEARYAHLLEPVRTVDTVVTERSRTWLGSRGGTTYVLVASGDSLEREGAAAIVRLERGGDLFALVGLYRYDAGALTLDVATRFTALQDAGTPQLARRGAVREAIFPEERQDWGFEPEGDRAFLRPPESPVVEMRPFEAVADGMRARGRNFPALVARLLALPLWMSQARIPGFGGARMGDYLSVSPVTFAGLLSGDATLEVAEPAAPRQTLRFRAVEQLTDVFLDGRWRREANLTGRGTLSGRLDVRFEGDGASETWSLDVGGVRLEQGLPVDGTVSWISPATASPEPVPAQTWTDLDFSLLHELVQ